MEQISKSFDWNSRCECLPFYVNEKQKGNENKLLLDFT